ncbi:hypothetical protein FT663_01293 [Candidozyma haemuli var. vulneris]|uniref:Pirin n=1 Tax=Candidozyma haemuli TaxID=45357 RepID=A0A2V1AX62_9ASCO|nr:hypothetical protein CXQ85_004970 [[Candida] haemuloni]KAF3992158.1 hypothetical protein FT662_01328 [[Candida] haemuloni var. vulneris]KAF3994603.1 hypothetical protein FT663_01293 [[Candida] haemuloni var. vulneris]PVH22402.1 hypothetical protein CXQ85_004970 [[Candida] haemuloni]
MASQRTIKTILPAIEQAEGVGARVRRSIGNMNMRNFSPFLMFDHFSSNGKGGFPEHPHLGQETITLMMKGAFAHEDFTGSKGVLRENDLQFMTAGRGTVHSEMPVIHPDGSANVGLQLWVDLPEKLKEVEPRYRDLKEWEVPEVTDQDGKVTVRVISGESLGVKSEKDLAYTPVNYYHYKMKPGSSFTQAVPKDFNFFLYLMQGGTLKLHDGSQAKEFDNVFFNADGDTISAEYPESNTKEAEFVLVGGQVLDQPVVQHGPFVATSRDRIVQAFTDYQYARNGFERLKSWNTLISGGVTEDMINNELGGSLEARAAEKRKFLGTKDEL